MGNYKEKSVINQKLSRSHCFFYNLLVRMTSTGQDREFENTSANIDKLKKGDINLGYRIYSYQQRLKYNKSKPLECIIAKLKLTQGLLCKNRDFRCAENRNDAKADLNELPNDEMHDMELEEYKSLQNYRRKLIESLKDSAQSPKPKRRMVDKQKNRKLTQSTLVMDNSDGGGNSPKSCNPDIHFM